MYLFRRRQDEMVRCFFVELYDAHQPRFISSFSGFCENTFSLHPLPDDVFHFFALQSLVCQEVIDHGGQCGPVVFAVEQAI